MMNGLKIEGIVKTDSEMMFEEDPNPRTKALVILFEKVDKDYVYVASQSVEIGSEYCFENLKGNAEYTIQLEYERKEWNVKTYCDLVARLKELLSVLGIEFWYVYFEEWFRWANKTHSTFHTEKEPCEVVTLGNMGRPHVCLIVDDPMSLFIRSQEFQFIRRD